MPTNTHAYMRKIALVVLTIWSGLLTYGQTTLDSAITTTGIIQYDSISIYRNLDEIIIVQQRSAKLLDISGSKLVVNAQDISTMPKFLGTSDPLRYMQSIAGVQTNNETTTGLHIQGCDDYQSLITINNAPIYYPNHLMGLFSSFIAPHFNRIIIEQAEHNGLAANRIGGLVNLETHSILPERFSIEGNVGLINTDLTLTIPCGKKSAIWISGRGSYIDLLYGRWLRVENMQLRYRFADANLTYAIHPTPHDKIVLSGFYSRDKIRLYDSALNIQLMWQNIVGSAYWNRHWDKGSWRTTISSSHFGGDNAVTLTMANGTIQSHLTSIDLKNQLQLQLADNMQFALSADYVQYISQPMQVTDSGLSIIHAQQQPIAYGEEASLGLNWQHQVTDKFLYSIGLHSSIYHTDSWHGACDPRIAFTFIPKDHHTLTLHTGMYTQYFHKARLTDGGLPTDFFLLADSSFIPERAIGLNLRYTAQLQYGLTLQTEAYFKQIYNTIESGGNVLQLLNNGFDYYSSLLKADGRNFGMNIMLQRGQGIITGYISYTLGWALRRIPDLEASPHYIYPASHERRHDLNIVLNARFAKRWCISGQFVLATGTPYTQAQEMYFLNSKLIWKYDKYNGANLPLYHRLDLSCSYDIIKKNQHELGINLSLYNVYCHKNVQFMVYRTDLKPIKGTTLITITPSISLYGKF